MGCLSSWFSTLTQRYTVLTESKVLFPNSIKYCQMPPNQITEKILQSKIEYVFWWGGGTGLQRQRRTYSSSIWISDRMWRNQNWHYDETLNVPVINVLFHFSEVCFHHLWRSCFLSIANFIASWWPLLLKRDVWPSTGTPLSAGVLNVFLPAAIPGDDETKFCVIDGNLFWNVTAANNKLLVFFNLDYITKKTGDLSTPETKYFCQ